MGIETGATKILHEACCTVLPDYIVREALCNTESGVLKSEAVTAARSGEDTHDTVILHNITAMTWKLVPRY